MGSVALLQDEPKVIEPYAKLIAENPELNPPYIFRYNTLTNEVWLLKPPWVLQGKGKLIIYEMSEKCVPWSEYIRQVMK